LKGTRNSRTMQRLSVGYSKKGEMIRDRLRKCLAKRKKYSVSRDRNNSDLCESGLNGSYTGIYPGDPLKGGAEQASAN